MTIWDAETKKADFLDAREIAPLAATEDMFDGNPNSALFGKTSFYNNPSLILSDINAMYNFDILECSRGI